MIMVVVYTNFVVLVNLLSYSEINGNVANSVTVKVRIVCQFFFSLLKHCFVLPYQHFLNEAREIWLQVVVLLFNSFASHNTQFYR